MSLRLGVGIGLLLAGAACWAQVPVGVPTGFGPYRGTSPHRGFSPYIGGAYGPVYSGGGTIAGSQMHGMADLVRSSGYANLLNSQAAVAAQAARSAELDNRVKYAEAYYERRRIRARAKAETDVPMTQEKAYRLAQAQRPDRLTEQEYNKATGEIQWPRALRMALMNGTRRRIEQLFAQRSVTGKLDADTYYEILRMCQFLEKQLTTEIRNDTVPMQDGSQALAFIKRVLHEARMLAN